VINININIDKGLIAIKKLILYWFSARFSYSFQRKPSFGV